VSEPWNIGEFQSRTEQCSFEFLKADLDLCLAFAALAETELAIHDVLGSQQALEKAEDGYAVITKVFLHFRGIRQRSDIRRGLQELRSRLDNLKSRLPEQLVKAARA